MKKTKIGRILPALALLAAVLLAVICLWQQRSGVCREVAFLIGEESEAERRVKEYAKEKGLRYSDYPESLIALLERNPEAEDFVLSYPLEKDLAHPVDLSGMETDSLPLFLQWDKRWGYIPYGNDVAGLTGCGPVCLSMAAFYVTGNPAYSPDYMLRFAMDNGYCLPGNGSAWALISEGGEKLGLRVRELPLHKPVIFSILEEGAPVICVMGPGDFTSSGHFIVLTGVKDGQLQVNDPNSIANSQKLWAYEDIEGQFLNLWEIRS